MGLRGLAAVSDAGPLIHLAEIRSLALLNVFSAVHVPHAVWDEVVGQGRVAESYVLDSADLHRHTFPREKVRLFVERNALLDLHAGECECLYCCKTMNIGILLTDDLAVRDAARRLGITPVGSLGVVVRACRTKMIAVDDAIRRIIDLHDVSSMFVTRAIVDLAIDQLEKHLRS